MATSWSLSAKAALSPSPSTTSVASAFPVSLLSLFSLPSSRNAPATNKTVARGHNSSPATLPRSSHRSASATRPMTNPARVTHRPRGCQRANCTLATRKIRGGRALRANTTPAMTNRMRASRGIPGSGPVSIRCAHSPATIAKSNPRRRFTAGSGQETDCEELSAGADARPSTRASQAYYAPSGHVCQTCNEREVKNMR